MWFRQMAQLSTTMSHAQRATAFHCSFPVSMTPGGSQLATLYLLDLKFLLSLDTLAAGALALLSDGRIAHLNVGHVSRCAGRPATPRYGWFR